VNQSVLENRRLDEVILYRYHNHTWTRLNTTALGDDRFAARTPGFSTFAIVGVEANAGQTVETTTALTTSVTTDRETTSRRTTAQRETTATESPGFGTGVAVLTITLLAVLAARRPE
jgi:hypothetical protein